MVHNLSAEGVCSECNRSILEFELIDNSYRVKGLDRASAITNLTIPSTYNNLPVTSIGDYAFYYCTSLTSITIPNSVTSIGERAFYSSPIEYASIPTSAISYIPKGNLKEVVITSGDSIGDYAFYDCYSLTSVTIGNSVTSIGDDAFRNCDKLVEVYNLSSINIEKGSEDNGYVGYYAKGVYTSLNTPSKLSTDSNGYIIYTDGEEKILMGYVGNETALTLPSDITSINDYAFYHCYSLTSVTIPNSVTSIGDDAFAGCTSLTSVTIGNSVKSIGYEAFYDCDSLTSVTIPNSVTSIGSAAFQRCDKLTSVTIGNSVTSIGRYAFEYCSSLTSITFNDTTTWYRVYNSSNWENKTGGTLVDVTNPTNNDELFVDNYYNYYWYKK